MSKKLKNITPMTVAKPGRTGRSASLQRVPSARDPLAYAAAMKALG